MRVPYLQVGPLTDSRSIHLMWGALESPGNGGEGVTLDYKVYWAKGNFNSQWEVLAYYTQGATQIETKQYTD
jgi:hypothetical protein